jgi:hypothetical protein
MLTTYVGGCLALEHFRMHLDRSRYSDKTNAARLRVSGRRERMMTQSRQKILLEATLEQKRTQSMEAIR